MPNKSFLVQLWAAAILVAMVIGQSRCSLIVLPIIPSNTNTHYHSLDSWCTNMTGHMYRTIQQFGKIAFNKTSQLMSPGITEAQRLAFDRRDLEIYSLLFEGISLVSNTSLAQVIQNCVTLNRGGISTLIMAMKMSEMYLNGIVSTPVAVSSSVVQDLGYKDIAQNMAALKGQFRKLAEIIGKNYLASVDVR